MPDMLLKMMTYFNCFNIRLDGYPVAMKLRRLG
jgi:hypothetical protein